MFRYKYEDNSKGGRISISEAMVDEVDGVEVRFDGFSPEIIFFRYKDSDISFRLSTYREKSEWLSDTLVVTLGYDLSFAEQKSKEKEISPERIREISRRTEEALLAWPADSRVMNWPPQYMYKKMPFRNIKILMAGWEGRIKR